MEIKKHIKIILNEDGTFAVGDGMGCPIAGECNAFFVELEYPAYYSGYNKSAYLSFNGSEEVYDLNNKDGFFLPSGINKGGVVSVTATAYKNVNIGIKAHRNKNLIIQGEQHIQRLKKFPI